MNYWEIVLWDGETIKVKPENAELIQKKIATQEGAINTPGRTIVVKNIKDFRETDEPYNDHKLLESGANAFNEPIFNPDGSVVVRWVKKDVTKRQYDKYYSAIPAYRKIGESGTYTIIMWRQPVHQIDTEWMSELSVDDERKLSKRI